MSSRFFAFMWLLLSGCSATVNNFDEGMPYLLGKPIDFAIGYLGFPDREQKLLGKMAYIWEHSDIGTSVETVSTPSYGTIHSPNGSAYYSGQNTKAVPTLYHEKCLIRLMVDETGIVMAGDWKGNRGGCAKYSAAVDKMKTHKYQ